MDQHPRGALVLIWIVGAAARKGIARLLLRDDRRKLGRRGWRRGRSRSLRRSWIVAHFFFAGFAMNFNRSVPILARFGRVSMEAWEGTAGEEGLRSYGGWVHASLQPVGREITPHVHPEIAVLKGMIYLDCRKLRCSRSCWLRLSLSGSCWTLSGRSGVSWIHCSAADASAPHQRESTPRYISVRRSSF